MDVRELSELIHGIKLSMWGKSGLSSELARNMYLAESLIAHGVTVQGEIDANTYQHMRECERLKKQNESFANAVNVLEEINSDLCKQIKGVTVQEWIPVSEPPKEKGTYIVCTDKGGILLGHWYGKEWNVGGGAKKHLAYWMKKPQPPKGE